MAVLMTYHKLVERDAKNVDVYWKVTSIILLVLAVICSLFLSFSLQKIVVAFDGLCPLDAKLEFEHNKTAKSVFENLLPSIENGTTTDSVTAERRFATVAEFFEASTANRLQSDSTQEYPIEQLRFLNDYKLNELTSVWGKKSSCDFGVYIPICQSCFGIIMAVMFIICGRGGKSEPNAFLPQPWRIVSPALIFFLIMTILSIVDLVIIQKGMNSFCQSFQKQMPDISCGLAMNNFMITSVDLLKLPPDVSYKMLIWFNYLSFSIWMLSLFVLLARILFVIDFQLVRVTLTTIEYEKANESSIYQAVEVEENGKDECRSLKTTQC